MINTSPLVVYENKDTRDAYFEIVFRFDDKKYKISAIELALQLLAEDGKVFTSHKDKADKCANLYGMNYSSAFSHHNGFYYVYFSISVVDEAYIKTFKNLRLESIKLLQKVITSGIKNSPSLFALLRSNLTLFTDDITSSPQFISSQGIKENICKDYLLGDLPYGTNKEIMETSLKDINDVLENFKLPPYEIVYYGRTSNNIKEKISSLFSIPSNIEERIRREFTPTEIKEEESETSFDQSLLTMVYKSFKYNDEKEYIILQLLSFILIASSTSRLFTTIREKLHLVYDISSNLDSDNSLIIISAPLKNINKNITVTNIKKVMEEAKTTLTNEELTIAKTKFIRSINSINNEPEQKINFITQMLQVSLSYETDTYLKLVEEITLEDLNKYIKSIDYVGSYYVKGRGE